MTDRPTLLEDNLETLIDRHGLYSVTEMLAIVCELKAGHLVHSWQDENAGKRWEAAAKVFDNAVAKLRKIQVAS